VARRPRYRRQIADARHAVAIGAADSQEATSTAPAPGDPIARGRRVAVNRHGDLIPVANRTYRGDMMQIAVKLR
jgi:DNA-binding GntR family transcriptional regulator